MNIDWENGKLKKAVILSRLGNDCKLRYEDKVLSIGTEKGKTYAFDGELKMP